MLDLRFPLTRCVVAVKDVVLKLKPLLTKNKLLVSVAAGVKLKDLQVTESYISSPSFLHLVECSYEYNLSVNIT